MAAVMPIILLIALGLSLFLILNALDHMNELVSYIKYCEHNNFAKDGLAGYISYKKAKDILRKATTSNNTNIDYLVVVPPAQNKGVGFLLVY